MRSNYSIFRYALVVLQKSRDRSLARERGEELEDEDEQELEEGMLRLDVDKQFPSLDIEQHIQDMPHRYERDHFSADAAFP